MLFFRATIWNLTSSSTYSVSSKKRCSEIHRWHRVKAILKTFPYFFLLLSSSVLCLAKHTHSFRWMISEASYKVSVRTPELLRCEMRSGPPCSDGMSLHTSLRHHFWRWGRGYDVDVIFTCCHVSATWRCAGRYLFSAFFFSGSNSTLAVNGVCLLSKSASVVTPSSGGMVASQHVQDLLSPWQQFLFFLFLFLSFAALFYSQKLHRATVLARTLSTSPSPRGEYTSCEWQEVQIKDGTEYFLVRWAAMGGNELTQEI